MRKRLLFEVSGVVQAPLARVAEVMFRDAPPSGTHSEVDRAGHMIAYWGDWWYRGEDSLEPVPSGTRVVHRVFTIARQGTWAVYLANKFFIGYRASLERGMRARLADYEAKLTTLAE